MCFIDKVMLNKMQVRRVTLKAKLWRHECCVGQTSSEQCMLGQIQWMSSSLCNSALRLSTVERSSSFWGGSKCSKCYTHTHAENVFIIFQTALLLYKNRPEKERESDAAHQHFSLQQHLGLLLKNFTAVDNVYSCTATQTLQRKHTHTATVQV